MEPVLDIENLTIRFKTHKVDIPAVVGFGCQVMPGETVGLVGESGCGKSTVAFAVMRYLSGNGRIAGGSVRFMGRDLGTVTRAELREIWGRQIAMVYQEPSSSLNPSMRIARQLAEPLVVLEGLSWDTAEKRARDMLEAVRLPDPDRILRSYPHQISGGQQQRVVIAMALLGQPKLLLMDEPTTSLDVTVEAGIIDLVSSLSDEFGVSVLFISTISVLCGPAVTGSSSCIPVRQSKAGQPARFSTRRAIPIHAVSCRRCRCPTPTSRNAPSARFQASCPCHSNARRDVFLARAAANSGPGSATPVPSRFGHVILRMHDFHVAPVSRKSTGLLLQNPQAHRPTPQKRARKSCALTR